MKVAFTPLLIRLQDSRVPRYLPQIGDLVGFRNNPTGENRESTVESHQLSQRLRG